MKKPVLSNALPGVISEIGKNNGVIFSKSQSQLINDIKELYWQRENLKIIGKKGYELVKEKYTWDRILSSFKKIIVELLKSINI